MTCICLCLLTLRHIGTFASPEILTRTPRPGFIVIRQGKRSQHQSHISLYANTLKAGAIDAAAGILDGHLFLRWKLYCDQRLMFQHCYFFNDIPFLHRFIMDVWYQLIIKINNCRDQLYIRTTSTSYLWSHRNLYLTSETFLMIASGRFTILTPSHIFYKIWMEI